MIPKPHQLAPGPFSADAIRSGDPYELSNGHPILCSPTGRAGARRQGLAFEIIANDPAVEDAAIDPGISTEPGMLRAPDVAIGVPDGQGWSKDVPPLMVEYADVGQNEPDLQVKIQEFLSRGTRHIWIVRLVGPRRVEVHEPDKPMVILGLDDELSAPGFLANPVPVAALFDQNAARAATLRNLLQREGYADLDAVLAEGRSEGKSEGRSEGKAEMLLSMLEMRFGALPGPLAERVRRATDAEREQIGRRSYEVQDLAQLLPEA